MDTPTPIKPKLKQVRHEGSYDTREMLDHARQQAVQRKFNDFLIVDIDSHHYEFDHWGAIASLMEDPVLRQLAGVEASTREVFPASMRSNQVGYHDLGGRITRSRLRKYEKGEPGINKDVTTTLRFMDSMGIDYAILFPLPMLQFGLHPQRTVEVALARAYNRWLVENVLAAEPRIKSMLYLPFNDPEASLRLVKEFAGKPGVAGFMVTTVRFKSVHDNAYMKLYAELQERNVPLAFHGAYNWDQDRMMFDMDRFISVHALSFPFYMMAQVTNWIVHGLPERFPKLRVCWIEGGLAWIPFLMQRLDNEFMMRTSEAPLLKRPPSDYMREMYYSTQPMETQNNRGALESTLKMIDAETQLMYASDYPHWDMDLPNTVYDLPFLGEPAKRNILGRNACRFLGLDADELWKARKKAKQRDLA